MRTVSSTEFRNNFAKYSAIAEKEEIAVTRRGIVIFRIFPEAVKQIAEAQSFFNLLPPDASIGGERE